MFNVSVGEATLINSKRLSTELARREWKQPGISDVLPRNASTGFRGSRPKLLRRIIPRVWDFPETKFAHRTLEPGRFVQHCQQGRARHSCARRRRSRCPDRPNLNQIEGWFRADFFHQSQRDCAPKPKVAERARLPWVLLPTNPSTPTGLSPPYFPKPSQINRGSRKVPCSLRTCSPTMNQIECFSRADLFVQSQRDCAPKPGVAERARLPWVLSHTISSTPTGLCLLLFSHTATDKLWFMERFPRNEVRALNP